MSDDEHGGLTFEELKDLAANAGLSAREDKRAQINVHPDRVVENIDEIEKVCIAESALLWQRDGTMVSAGLKKYKTWNDREVSMPCILEMTVPRLFKTVARYCKFRKFDGRSKKLKLVPAEPPRGLLASFLESELQLPIIKGVVDHPFLCADWSLVTTPGYDRQSGMFYHDHGALSFPKVPSNPSKDDARTALARLLHLFHTFEPDFDSEASRSVVIVMLLTALCRHMFDAAPIFAADATMAGSGKGLVIKTIAAVVIGQSPPLINQGHTPEETEKRLGAMLTGALRMIVFDNCLHDISDALLCSLATEERVNISILGKTGTFTVSLGSVLIYNGNNVTFRGETVSRVLKMRLDPKVRRSGQSPLQLRSGEQYALTIAPRWWSTPLPYCRPISTPDFHRCRPAQAHRGSRTGTSCAARWFWLGMADPYETTLAIKADDPDKQQFRTVLQHLFFAIWNSEVTVKEVIERACKRQKWSRTRRATIL